MADQTRNTGAVRAAVDRAIAEARSTAGRPLEDVLSGLSAVARTALGDALAAERPGALKPGERQFTVSGFFMLSPDGAENILIAEHGFPAEQRRLRIPATLGHPGAVVRHRRGLLLENTDDHADFEQILKTSRMGSAMYSPMLWQDRFLGQLITASQARNTYGPDDHMFLERLAAAATPLFLDGGGPAFVADLFRSGNGRPR